MSEEAKEWVESAQESQKKALVDLEVELKSRLDNLPHQVKTYRSLELAVSLEELAGMLRAKHFLTHGV